MTEEAIRDFLQRVRRLEAEVDRLKTQGSAGSTGGTLGQHGNEYHTPDFATQSDFTTHTGAENPHGTDFEDLGDTPANYSGSSLKHVRVNAGETGLEFVAPPADDFLDLTDTPNSYSSQASKYVRVKGDESGLEFVTAATGTITVEELDGAPSVASVDTIKVTNGTLTDNMDGSVTLDIAGGGGSGDSTHTGTLAGRGSPSNAGDIYLPSDGATLFRDTGAAWEQWGPIFRFEKPPALAGWTWVNQGTATATEDNEGIYLETPALTGQNMRVLARTAPSTPYTITAAFLPCWSPDTNNIIAIGWRDSSASTLALFGPAQGDIATGQKWTSPTAASTAYKTFVVRGRLPIFWRIADDGTNRICSYSWDGQNFAAFHSVTRTDFVATPDQVVFALQPANSGAKVGAKLIHWKAA